MSEEKKDLQLENELLACGFTHKDIKKLFDTTEEYYPVEVIKRIKVISYTTLLVIALSVISFLGIISSDYYYNKDILDSSLTAFIALAIVNIVINFIFPFRVGFKCSFFLIKKKFKL